MLASPRPRIRTARMPEDRAQQNRDLVAGFRRQKVRTATKVVVLFEEFVQDELQAAHVVEAAGSF